MNRVVRSVGIAAVFLMIAGVKNASAQITSPIEFTTSFPFAAGNSTLPAGAYTLRPDDDNPRILELIGTHGTVLFQAEDTRPGRAATKTEVVFKRHGDVYVLKNVWLEGSDTGAEVMTQEAERHAAKHHPTPTEQRIAARRVSSTAANN